MIEHLRHLARIIITLNPGWREEPVDILLVYEIYMEDN